MKPQYNALNLFRNTDAKFELDVTYPFGEVIRFITQELTNYRFYKPDDSKIIGILKVFYDGVIEVEDGNYIGIRLYNYNNNISPDNLSNDVVEDLNNRVKEVLG